jgi:hypothetical protein
MRRRNITARLYPNGTAWDRQRFLSRSKSSSAIKNATRVCRVALYFLIDTGFYPIGQYQEQNEETFSELNLEW